MNKFTRRASIAYEKRLIVEEVTYLMETGYRKPHYAQVMDGMQVALDDSTDTEWKNWAELPLKYVIDDFFHYGVP